jgi:hypothetical protein
MSYLTIDVGLKNLALCLMKKDQILLWDVYDLISDKAETCPFTNKNGQNCQFTCSVYTKQDGEQISSCKKHADKSLKIYTIKKKQVKDYLLQDIALLVVKKCNEMYSNNLELFQEIKGVYIELQPKINPKMKLVSHIIFGKFTELLSGDHPDCKVRFVPASKKLRAYKGPVIDTSHIKSKYKKRKFLSVEYTKAILKEKVKDSESWLCFLETHAKQDDLCDTFCMAINCLKM